MVCEQNAVSPLAARFRVVHVCTAVLVECVVGEVHEHVRRVVDVWVRVPACCEPKHLYKNFVQTKIMVAQCLRALA